MSRPTRYRLASPPPLRASGAIGIIDLLGDVSATLAALRTRDVPLGRASLRDVPDIDSVVIARIAPDHAMIFPHAGPAVMSRLINALESIGITRADDLSPREMYPEAASELEAHMLDALARAQSPLAIDLLLDQPRRWANRSLDERDPAHILPADDSRRLRHLIDPPFIVALGAPNIGKSSLVNALAGRGVSVVADVPGTTRDHVGVTLDLAGLVVRYVDTAGVAPQRHPERKRGADSSQAPLARAQGAEKEPPNLDAQSQSLALHLAAQADLILHCADATADYPTLPTPTPPTLRLGLRADLGPPYSGADLLVSVRQFSGLESLTAAIGDRLVPQAIREDPRAWVFW